MPLTLEQLDAKQQKLAKLMPLPVPVLQKLNDWYKIELAYTSNALSGSTITKEQAVAAIAGDPLPGILPQLVQEVKNHAVAWDFVRQLASSKLREQLDLGDICTINRLLLVGIDNDIAGQFRHASPPVQDAMTPYLAWLTAPSTHHPISLAIESHIRLIGIGPFTRANGRTARLLMNLILMQSGFPPIIIDPSDQDQYMATRVINSTIGTVEPHDQFIYSLVDRALNRFLEASPTEAIPTPNQVSQASPKSKKLLKIGQLANAVSETIPTIRFWTKEGLIGVASFSRGGYQLYDPVMIGRAKEIRQLQSEKRLSIKELKEHYKSQN